MPDVWYHNWLYESYFADIAFGLGANNTMKSWSMKHKSIDVKGDLRKGENSGLNCLLVIYQLRKE